MDTDTATAEDTGSRSVTLDCSVLQSLYEMCEATEQGVVEELVNVYLDSTPAQLAALRGAIDAQDARGAVETLHSMKGSAATIGAVRLAKVCRRLEQAARRGELSPAVVGVLERELSSLLAALTNLTASMS